MKNILLKSDTPHFDLDHQSDCVFSDSAVFNKVSTAIRNNSRQAQRAIKMSRVLSHSQLLLGTIIFLHFNSYLKRRHM